MTDTLPTDHLIGANNPPEPTPFEAIRVHIEDLDMEARNWADGTAITNDAQGAEVDRLIDDIKAAIKAAEGVQNAMLAPLAEQEKEIRARFYPLIGKTTKITGTAIRGRDALLAVKTKWAVVVATRQRVEADKLRAEAMEQARQAREAMAQATDNMEAADRAEDMIKAAQTLLRGATRAEAATVKGLRTVWRVTIADQLTAIRTMWKRYPDDFLTLATTLAERDVRAGNRAIEGFIIEPEKVAA